jgi:hypothetical protein
MHGKVHSWQVDQLELSSIDIAVVGAKGLFMHEFLKKNCLLLPHVNFTLDLRRPIDEVVRTMSRRRRRDVKKLESLGYGYSISRNRSRDFHFFYTKMYVPHAMRRFGKAALVSPYIVLKTLYGKNGGILFVKKGKKAVAGILFQTQKDVLHALQFGVYEGDEDLLKNLAGTASLYFLIQWAQKNSICTLNYGRTVPFFNDGIFRYKHEWGMHLEEYADQPFCALKLNPHRETSFSFLAQNPCIVYDDDSMKGLVVANHELGEKELRRISAQCLFPSLESLTIVCRRSDSNLLKDFAKRSGRIHLTVGAEPSLDACLPLTKPSHSFSIYSIKSAKQNCEQPST